MKISSVNCKLALVFLSATILAIFVTRPAFSQETAKKESHKKVILKIVSDDNGKTTVIDTTMEMSDTMMMDSLQNEVEKVIIIDKDGKRSHVRFRNMPEGFAYDFDMPPPPGCERILEGFKGLDWQGKEPCRKIEDLMREQMPSRTERRVMRQGFDRPTLNDLLGNIPMDRVVSYSIKDTKNGKRITIDLNDPPMFEKHK